MSGEYRNSLDVLAITSSTFPGGTDISLRNLAVALGDSDIRVTLAGPAASDLEDWWRSHDLPYVPLELGERKGFTGPGGVRTSPRELARSALSTASAIRAVSRIAADYDVLHSNWLFTHLDAVIAGRLQKTPVVLELHDIVPPGIGRRILTGIASRAAVSVSVSDAVRSQLGTSAMGNAVTIHQGIDTSKFSPGRASFELRAELARVNSHGAIAAVIGRLDPGKGVEYAIDAVGIVNRDYRRNVHLVMIGAPAVDDGSYATMLRAHADRVLPGQHLFLPARKDIVNILRSVDVLLAPSVDEPFGLIAAEAQSVGVPVVVSDSGGLSEFVVDGQTGHVVSTGDAEQIAGAINDVIADPAGAKRMSAAAREHMVKQFDIRRRAERMRKQYLSVASRRAGISGEFAS